MAITVTYGDYTLANPVTMPGFTETGRQITYTIAFLLQENSDAALIAAEVAARAAINKVDQDLTVKKGTSKNYEYSLSDNTAIKIVGKYERVESIGLTYLCKATFTIELPAGVLGTAVSGKAPYAAGFGEMQIDLKYNASELAMVNFSGVYTAHDTTDVETSYADGSAGAKAVATLWLTDFGGNYELIDEEKTYQEKDNTIRFRLTYMERIVEKGSSGANYKWRSIRVTKSPNKVTKAASVQYSGLNSHATSPTDTEASYVYNISAIIDVIATSLTYTSKQLENLYKNDIQSTLLSILGSTFESEAKIDTKSLEVDPYQNTISVSIRLQQGNSTGITAFRYKESLSFISNTKFLKKPDGKSHTYDLFEPGSEVRMTQIIEVDTERPYNMWNEQFYPSDKWKPGSAGWKLISAQDDLTDEILSDEPDGINVFSQFMTRSFMWISSDTAAKEAPQTDSVYSAATGR